MKLISKGTLIAACIASSVIGYTSAVSAGEGGAAGAASFTLENGKVVSGSVAASVGKNAALAGATSEYDSAGKDFNSAFAVGSGGTITVSSIKSDGFGKIEIGNDTSLGTAQSNNLQSVVLVTPNVLNYQGAVILPGSGLGSAASTLIQGALSN